MSYGYALEDIKKVRSYDINILIPGHGPAIYKKKNIHNALDSVKKGKVKFTMVKDQYRWFLHDPSVTE